MISYESFGLVMCLWTLISSCHSDDFPDCSKALIVELSIEKGQKVCTYNLMFFPYYSKKDFSVLPQNN